MNPQDTETFYRLVKERSGLTLTAAKTYLIESRLKPIAAEEKLDDVAALLARLRMRMEERLIRRCVDAMATHESFFFRDGTPFDQLRQALPALLAARAQSKTLRIWSAACSSGQEAYSIAILLQEFQTRLSGWRVEIVATDMSEAILAKARAGLFSDFEAMRGLTQGQRTLWMRKVGDQWEVSPKLRELVTFKPHNLLNGASGLGVFDVVFCRNVLIYFDRAAKGRALASLAAAMASDGLLFLGSAETVLGLTDRFEAASDGRGSFRRTQAELLKRA